MHSRKPLTDDEFARLVTAVRSHAPQLMDVLVRGEVLSLPLSVRNALRGAVSDEFVARGLRDDYEPNAYGLELEHLIDRLGP